MARIVGHRHALISRYGQHRRPESRLLNGRTITLVSHCLNYRPQSKGFHAQHPHFLLTPPTACVCVLSYKPPKKIHTKGKCARAEPLTRGECVFVWVVITTLHPSCAANEVRVCTQMYFSPVFEYPGVFSRRLPQVFVSSACYTIENRKAKTNTLKTRTSLVIILESPILIVQRDSDGHQDQNF